MKSMAIQDAADCSFGKGDLRSPVEPKRGRGAIAGGAALQRDMNLSVIDDSLRGGALGDAPYLKTFSDTFSSFYTCRDCAW
jgi:hypothetical protein